MNLRQKTRLDEDVMPPQTKDDGLARLSFGACLYGKTIQIHLGESRKHKKHGHCHFFMSDFVTFSKIKIKHMTTHSLIHENDRNDVKSYPLSITLDFQTQFDFRKEKKAKK